MRKVFLLFAFVFVIGFASASITSELLIPCSPYAYDLCSIVSDGSVVYTFPDSISEGPGTFTVSVDVTFPDGFDWNNFDYGEIYFSLYGYPNYYYSLWYDRAFHSSDVSGNTLHRDVIFDNPPSGSGLDYFGVDLAYWFYAYSDGMDMDRYGPDPYPISIPVETNSCGNSVCDAGEDVNSCPSDCTTYGSFGVNDCSNINLNGNAVLIPEGIQLNPSSSYAVGSAWAPNKLDLTQDFDVKWNFKIDTPDSIGADGFAFVIQNQGSDAIGAAGGGIGYDGILNGALNGLAVEFDTYTNTGASDPDNNHIGINIGSRLSATHSDAPYSPAVFLSNGLVQQGEVKYIASSNTLEVYHNNVKVITKNNINLQTTIGNDAWYGFTSATGANIERHQISNFKLNGNDVCSASAVGDICSGLVGYWNFDGNANDASGNGNNGVVNGDVQLNAAGKSAGYGNSAFFNGGYIDVGDNLAYFNNGLTISVWAKPTSNGNYERFIDFGNGASSDNIIFAREGTSNNLVFVVFNGGNEISRITVTNGIINDEWHHYVATEDASGNVRIYRDGNLIGSGTTSVPRSVQRSSSFIGKSNWPDSNFGGYMDDLKVYNRALNLAEVQQLFADTSPSCSSSLPSGICNNNKLCEAGETVENCPADCTPYPACNNVNLVSSGNNAKYKNGIYQLTEPVLGGQAGAIWYKTKLSIDSSWEVSWNFKINESGITTPSDGNTGGDGFAFVIQNDTSSALGRGAYGIGYDSNLAPGVYGTGYRTNMHGLAVEFDTIQNSPVDSEGNTIEISSNHISIQTNAPGWLYSGNNYSIAHTDQGTLFDNEQVHSAKIKYDAVTEDLYTYYDGVLVGDQPITTYKGYTYDNLSEMLGFDSAYFGFTSGTGDAWARHMIWNWTINGQDPCNGITPSSGNGGVAWNDVGGNNISIAVLGQTVKLVAQTSGISNGALMVFEIYEKSNLLNDHAIRAGPKALTAVVYNNRATATWAISETEIKQGGGVASNGNYELYFDASTSANGGFDGRSGILKVPETSGACVDPIADITSPIEGNVYLADDLMLFNHSSYDTLGGSLTVSWSVDELPGVKKTLNSFTHSFTTSGQKVVRLTVTNACGKSDTDEKNILILGAGKQLFTAINEPLDDSILMSKSVSYDGSESYVLDTTGSYPNYNVECLGGNCPLSVSCTSCNIPIGNSGNKRGVYDMLNFSWTFGSDKGLPLIVSGYGSKDGTHNYLGYGMQSIKLNLAYPAGGLVGEDTNSFMILLSNCDKNSGTWYDINGNPFSTGLDNICQGLDGDIGTADDCCQVGAICINDGGIARCDSAMCVSTYLVPPDNELLGIISLCEHYNYIDGDLTEKERQCTADCNNVWIGEEQQSLLNNLISNGNTITSEGCEWVTSEDLCGIRYYNSSNGHSYSRYVINSGECIDGVRTVTYETKEYDSDGNLLGTLTSDPIEEACDVLIVPLSFFGEAQFIGVLILIVVIYLIYLSMKKNHNNTGNRKRSKRRK